ncbi:MAG: superfamily II DNA/RNA helicase [Bacillariaceae sp.]|jgi:superfamily II DNA/RNA helicase
MLLKSPPPDGSLRKVKFYISQPRRIAAKALVERVRSCEPDLKDKFSLRMGGGWKEYESKETQVSFVTTGYLVRLLANHPEKFNECTHLVIDEVHERSVDTDLLCLLSRRLLQTNRTIRLVLMSATLATKMYRDYFSVINEPIHVGVRTFPITEYFIEDLSQFGLPSQEGKAVSAIQREIESKRCVTAPKSAEISNRFALTARLATIVGEPGSSVLIFVPGMGEIVSITECIESFHMTGIRYTCFPIHGDIPFEEQMNAFNDPEEDEVKVIIATNAAESSVTLPAVDHVICLGLCKQIIYNQASHRQMLTPAWISRASATQRAGRTGRVRPGNVYRLYTRRAFENYMEEFEPGEMLRIPLDSVILLLKQILHEEVIPAFMDCLEPPPLDTISRSFQSLHHWGFITEADDKADITSLGSFVSSLGVDLSLGAFIGMGIQFGVAAEAIEMAAMMSLTKTPFQITSPMWLTPDEFNVNASQTYAAKCNLDAGLYSEPLALMNALWDYVTASNKNTWCYKNKIAATRWKQAVSSRTSIRKRVADFLGVNEDRLQVQLPPRDMPREKLLFLRLLMVWVFSDSIIECAPSKLKLSQDDSVTLSIKGKSSGTPLKEIHLDRILQSEKHPYNIIECNEVEQTGVFEEDGIFYLPHFVNDFDFEDRLISYASEKGIEAILCYSDEGIFLYLEEFKMPNGLWTFLETVTDCSTKNDIFVYDYTNKKRRGLQERACGVWTIDAKPQGDFTRRKQFKRIDLKKVEVGNEFGRICSSMIHELYQCNLKSKMTWHFFTQRSSSKKKKKYNSVQPFFVTTIGECRKVSKPDLEDLLGRKPLSVSENVKNSAQSIVLKRPPIVSQLLESRGFRQPLFLDVPEGARILAMLASSQRKGKYILRIPRNNSDDPEDTVNFSMAQDEIDVSKRWRRLDTAKLVYVDESVPSTAIHTTNDLYAVAANSLELQQGGLRVDGLTLLPPNPLFLLLSLLSFGLEPDTPLLWSTQSEEVGAEKKVHKSYSWLVDKVTKNKNRGDDQTYVSGNASADAWVLDRLRLANVFHQNSLSMGEKLACFPDRIIQLCALFDGVEGELTPWESITEEALTMENLSTWRMERKTSTKTEYNGPRRTSVSDGTNKKYSTPKKNFTPRKNSTPATKSTLGRSKNRKTEINSPTGKKLEHHAIRHFDSQFIISSNLLFSTTLNNGETMPAFPSTNILALVFKMFEGQVLKIGSNDKSKFKVSLNAENWDVACYKENNDDTLYKARFVNDSIGDISVVGRGKNKLPKWIKKNSERPSTIADAKACVPPNVLCPKLVESDSDGLLFESIEEALQMEAAFWLNRQFCHAGKVDTRNWYAHSIDQMINILQKQHDGSLEQMQEEYSSNF